MIPTVLLVVMGLAPIMASAGPAPRVGAVVPPRIMQRLSQISRNGLQDTAPPNDVLMNAIAGALVHSHRPHILYVGADYCPYCAALRWPLVLTLLRFGSLQGLKFMRSSATDVFADTATFSFFGSTYKSPWIGFEGFETSTRTGRPLMSPPRPVRSLFNAYDAPPFTMDAGAIPFLYINGLYVISGSPIPPAIFKGDDWSAIIAGLGQPTSAIFEKVIPETNLLTAAFCEGMVKPPRRVCESPGVMVSRHFLPKP
ncbi:MAG: DUF929 family protein [Gammaproteobacteria bacterium]